MVACTLIITTLFYKQFHSFLLHGEVYKQFPSLHSQVYQLIASIHVAFLLQVLEIHSSMSKRFNINFINNKYIWEFDQEPNAWNISSQVTCTGSSISSKSFLTLASIWTLIILTRGICITGIGNTFVNIWKI